MRPNYYYYTNIGSGVKLFDDKFSLLHEIYSHLGNNSIKLILISSLNCLVEETNYSKLLLLHQVRIVKLLTQYVVRGESWVLTMAARLVGAGTTSQ